MISSLATMPYCEAIPKRSGRKNIVNMFVFAIFVLEIIAALLSAQTMASQWSELTVAWPYEITFCTCEFMVIVLIKVCQLYMTSIASQSKRNRYMWLTMLLSIPCLLLMCCGLIACRLVKVRTYNKLVWSINQSTFGAQQKNNTIPYVDTYQIISMSNYDTRSYVKTAWDNVQAKYSCCGSNAPQDWSMVRSVLPKSCCAYLDGNCVLDAAYKNGCSTKVTEILFEQLRYLEATIFILMIFECLTIVFVFISIVGNYVLGVAKRMKRLNAFVWKDELFVPVSTIDGNGMLLATTAEHLG